jgi:hypothetical protein
MHLPSSSDWEREIATLEDEANRAFVNRDVERLDQLFSDALQFSASFGTRSCDETATWSSSWAPMRSRIRRPTRSCGGA